MRLKIENLAKIGIANLELNGLTVIAGENDTGKSTIGKILFAFFNAASGIDEKIKDSRRRSIITKTSSFIDRHKNGHSYPSLFGPTIDESIFDDLWLAYEKNEAITTNDILLIFEKSKEKLDNTDFATIPEKEVNLFLETVLDSIKLTKAKISLEIFNRYFHSVFNKQINSLSKKQSDTRVELTIQDKINAFKFSNNNCVELNCPTPITNNCIYIDDPFILDGVGVNNYYAKSIAFDYKKQQAINFLEQYFYPDLLKDLVESLIQKDKWEDIFSKLNSLTNGDIISSNGAIYYKQDGYEDDLNIGNLSAGLKSIIILKMMIDKFLLKDKDLLILDEPEIHLHPKWQIVYAEIIILLQKTVNLHIVITTHSPYFLEAIELYSKYYDVYTKFNCYISEINLHNQISFENITNNLEKAYAKLAYPITELETLRYNLAETSNK